MALGSSLRFPWLKVAAAGLAVGLHAAALAMILSAPVAQVAMGEPDAFDVQFVELGPVDEPVAATLPAEPLPEIPEPEVIVPPDPEPFFEPEPIVEAEPEPEPEPVVEVPEPEAITEAPEPPPKPKQQPKPKPQPKQKPKPQAAPPPKPVAVVPVTAGGAKQTSQAKGESQPVDPDRPRTIGRVDYLGKRPSPDYPRTSQRRREQGRVVLRVLISPLGQVASVKVQKSSGHERLDQAAVDAMQRARFRPYTENGIAYKALVDIPFDFVL
ncbi:energy transducer TonB [Castellaniella sp.]|uniref:energy transducer TonB n=1 Tax=Castellaniella sp. TaxID=1955812 RepID=UPI002AFEEA34|nr:energy transducer TonB [Castellaniella sp.]